jgi:hypothetical protein
LDVDVGNGLSIGQMFKSTPIHVCVALGEWPFLEANVLPRDWFVKNHVDNNILLFRLYCSGFVHKHFLCNMVVQIIINLMFN